MAGFGAIHQCDDDFADFVGTHCQQVCGDGRDLSQADARFSMMARCESKRELDDKPIPIPVMFRAPAPPRQSKCHKRKTGNNAHGAASSRSSLKQKRRHKQP